MDRFGFEGLEDLSGRRLERIITHNVNADLSKLIEGAEKVNQSSNKKNHASR